MKVFIVNTKILHIKKYVYMYIKKISKWKLILIGSGKYNLWKYSETI